MTIVVAVLCRDGVVLGADGAATSGTSRKSVDKLILGANDQFAFSLAGNPTMGGACFSAAEAAWKAQQNAPNAYSFAAFVRQHIFQQVLHPELQVATASMQAAPMAQQQVWNSVQCASIIAGSYGGKPLLFSVSPQGQLTIADLSQPTFAIGSGGPIADPFLLFLKRLLWPTSTLPDIGLGILTVLWTLEHAIETTPHGVGPPVSLAIVSNGTGSWKARRIPTSSLDEHRQAMRSAEAQLAQFVAGVQLAEDGVAVASPPQSPPPPPSSPPEPPADLQGQ